jgi:type I restriction enzyme, S subunit
MEVRPGYKQTEVGVVPEDWVLHKLTSLADVRDGTHDSPSYISSGVPFVTSKNIVSGRVDLDDITFISEEDAREVNRRSKVDRNDILLSMIGTVGNAALVDFEPGFCIKNVALVKPDPSKADPRFLVQLFRSASYARYIEEKLEGGIQKFISLGVLRALDVPFPPTRAEQEAIAEALSDADALVESLEQLLAKRCQLKQGVMQELLTGKRRLPGFSGDWEVVSLDGVVERITGFWGASGFSPDRPRCTEIIRAGDISQDGLLTGSAQRFLSDPEFLRAHCRFDDMVITTSGNGLGKVWWCDGRPDVAASNFVRILRPIRGKSQGRYLAYALRTGVGLKQLQEHTATSAYPNLRPSFFAEPWMSLPPISEQATIAGILSDIGAAIAAVETKLAKARQIKQGIMQELLTGRIRLV